MEGLSINKIQAPGDWK